MNFTEGSSVPSISIDSLTKTQIYPGKFGYNPTEMFLMVIITGLTNFAVIPTVVMFYKQRMMFQMYMSIFTVMGSFMYHYMDSVQAELIFLNQGEWHRLDNVGSIMCFMMLFCYLSDFNNFDLEINLNYFGFFICLICQEADPWNLNYTVGPLVFWGILCILIKVKQRTLPRLDPTYLRYSLLFLVLAVYCFSQGLDEFKDYLRFYHGLWHLFVSIFSFFMWQTKLNETERYTLMDVWKKPRAKYSYYWSFDNVVLK